MDTKNFPLMIARKRKGLTQEELADQVDSTRKWLSKIENNQGTPSLDLAKKIARALDSSTDDLFPDQK